MAPLPANDQYTWVPPTPIGVQQQAGFQAQLIGTAAGEFSPGNTEGWTVQTYLPLGTAGIVQTYSVKAPEAPVEPETPPAKPKTRKAK